MKFKKLISSSLALGLLINFTSASLASMLSEDGRYETFEGNNITIDNILEEDKVDVKIEGNTMVNIANQKDPVPITKAYTVKGTNHIPLQGEYDGKARPVIEGNTLVNIATGRLKVSKIGDYGAIHYSTEMLKTDIPTVYTVVVKNLPSDTRWCLTTHDQSTTYINYNTDNVAKFNSRSSYPSTISFIFNNDNIIWTEDILNNLEIMMIEGDLTDNPPIEYFEGLKSSFEDQLVTQEMVDSGLEKAENLGKYKVEYKVTGTNKVDESKLTTGYLIDNRDLLVEAPNCNVSDYIKVRKGDVYTVPTGISSSTRGVNFYDKNKKYTSTTLLSEPLGVPSTFIVPIDGYMRVNLWGDGFPIQINEGEYLLKYEPYKESIKTFYLNSPLLEGDTIEDIDGKATHVRRYNELIIDGSDDEDWFLNTPYSKGGQYVSYRSVSGIRPKSKSIIYCDKLKYIGECNAVNDCIWAYNNTSLVIQNSTIGTIEEFNQWLLENPITVVYPLAEPIYETISEESILCDSYKDGHLDLNSNISINKVDFMSTTTTLNYSYPSTEYTVQFESDSKGKMDRVSLDNEVLYGNYSVSKGINRFNIITPSEISSTELILDGIGFNLSNLVITEATDEKFGYFEGIKSVGQDDENGHKFEIISSNNQIPKTKILYKEHGIEINFASYAIKENLYAHNLSDKIITVHTVKDEVHSRRFLVNPNSTVFINLSDGESIYCFAGLYIDGWNNNTTELLKKSLILTKNENSFSKIEIPLLEPLRSLPNGVKDEIIKINGQWVVERNCGEVILDKNTEWNLGTEETGWGIFDDSIIIYMKDNAIPIKPYTQFTNDKLSYIPGLVNKNIVGIGNQSWKDMGHISIRLNKSIIKDLSISSCKEWLSENPITVVYQLIEPIYEPLNIDSTINTYLDVTHISNSSNISANMKVTIDRTINRAIDAIELAKTNPTVENLSKARMWSNLLKESIKKDELNNEINSITNIEDLQLERKTTTANIDVYIKSENMLLMSLSTNSITFNDYSGVEDVELNNAINISINSSLPYQLNSYLLTEIENSDKTNRIEKDLLNIKSNIDNNYKTFNDINEKLILEDDCYAGNNKSHSIDLKLKGSQAHKADIYKTVIKFEAEQK